ncbi:hypothetical protein NW768_002455 [Fusarium equiseti]|uniref:Uncharacterized protein n=1 Tax=Fusarium equiseti TaxID=61235 RepID=A0ABQ8RNP5_FUSEQ|nr:hypothetical protein NW768_002455 [Fusarium equiseti]
MAFKPQLPTILEEDEDAPPIPGAIWRPYCPMCCPVCKRNRTCRTVLRQQAKRKAKAKLKARAKRKPKTKIKIKARGFDVPKAGRHNEFCGRVWEDGTGHYTMKLWDGPLRRNVSSNVWYFKALSPYELTLFELMNPKGLPDFTDEDRKKLNADAMGWFNEQLDRALSYLDMEFFEDEVARLNLIEID